MEPTSEVMQEQAVETAAPSQDAGVQAQPAQVPQEHPQEQAVGQETAGRVEQNDALPPDGLALDEDGELQFGDRFFDAYREGQDGQKPEPTQSSDGGDKAATPPAFYTPDELKSFESIDQLDPARFPEAMQPYLPVIRDYVLALQRQVGLLRSMEASRSAPGAQTQAPQASQAPKPMEHKEIAALARKVAAERLGVKLEDLDAYDSEHVAALSLAVQEVAARNRAEVAAWQGRAQAQQELQRFTVDLASQPDFQQFDAWVTKKLSDAGITSDQVLAYAQQTGDLAGVQRTVAEMYREWRRLGAQPQPEQGLRQQTTAPPKVPVVESANGAAQVRETVDLRSFGDMDDDSQARALIKMGLV